MIRNYFKTAFRNLLKHKGFSVINISGLALGIAACLLLLQYVRLEKSYDDFHVNGDRIFRVQQDRYNYGKLSTRWAAGAAGIGPDVKAAIPEVESFAKLVKAEGVVSYRNEFFREEKMYYANDAFLPMFSYRVIKGKASGALAEPNTAVITESAARKYFGDADPMGKIFSLNKRNDFRITAVVADMPENTHLKFEVLLSFETYVKLYGPSANTTWNWDGFFTYLLLKPGADPARVESKMAALIDRKFGKELREGHAGLVLHLQPLRDIHLNSNYMMEAEVNGNGQAVRFLSIIAVFIMVIAWINYINLSTARSLERAREVGVRKVLGSFRAQLMRQFLFESFLINFLAVLLAVGLIVLTLPMFSSLAGRPMRLDLFSEPSFWQTLLVIFIGGTFLSGSYPAFILSSFRPVEVLKGRLARTAHGSFLRQALVVIQFSASVALLVGTYSVFTQLKYMESQDLGVQVDQTLVLRGPGVTDSTYAEKLNTFKTEMLTIPGITRVSASTEVPGNKVDWNAGGIRLVGSDPDKTNQYRVIGIDYDFVDAYGLKVLKGRNFSRKFATDPQAVLFNEAAVKLMGFNRPEEAINRKIDFWGEQYTIVGVVSNHHQESLREDFDALIFRLIPDTENFYSVKMSVSNNNWKDAIEAARTKWAAIFPGNPFEYFFLDDHFRQQYQSDRQFGKTFGLFAALAIIVACLGLSGLVSFVTTQRTKEIGIRKVLGAGIPGIVVLLTRDFIKPVLLSFAIATPVTWYFLNDWLGNYAFRIGITPWMFIVPAMAILLIAVITCSIQTVRAAAANPVKNLRTE